MIAKFYVIVFLFSNSRLNAAAMEQTASLFSTHSGQDLVSQKNKDF